MPGTLKVFAFALFWAVSVGQATAFALSVGAGHGETIETTCYEVIL